MSLVGSRGVDPLKSLDEGKDRKQGSMVGRCTQKIYVSSSEDTESRSSRRVTVDLFLV